MAYTTAANVRTYLGETSTADDQLLTTLIARAQAYIDRHCNRTFEAAQDSTRYFDALADVGGEHNRSLLLDADLCQITSITNGDGAAVASTEYTTVPRNSTPWYELQLKRGSDVAWTYDDDPEDALVIVGRWAYSVTAPADVAHACERLTVFLYRQKDSNADVDRPQQTAEGTWLMPMAMPKDIALLLAPYRRIAT
jgi:hypothetical protein